MTQALVTQVNAARGGPEPLFSAETTVFATCIGGAKHAAGQEELQEIVMTSLRSYPLATSAISENDVSVGAVCPIGVEISKTIAWRVFSRFVAAVIALPLLAIPAPAATLNVSGGQLLGASGVNVAGTLYDVQFLDGTCVALFSGCDNAAEDFTFPVFADATAAA